VTTQRSSWWQGTRGEWWVVAQLLLLAAVGILPPRGRRSCRPRPQPPLSRLSAAVMLVAGAVALGSNLSILPSPREGAQVVRHGVYRWVRHPIYSGVILLVVGWACTAATCSTWSWPLALAYSLQRRPRARSDTSKIAFPTTRDTVVAVGALCRGSTDYESVPRASGASRHTTPVSLESCNSAKTLIPTALEAADT